MALTMALGSDTLCLLCYISGGLRGTKTTVLNDIVTEHGADHGTGFRYTESPGLY